MKRMLTGTAAVAAAAALSQSGAASSIEITPLVLQGDDVPTVGQVTSIDNLAINDNGEWIVELDTNNEDTNSDGALIRNGLLYLREGQPLSAPAGAFLGSFDSITLNNGGRSGWNFFLDGLPTGQDSGVYWGDSLLIAEGAVATAPEFSPGTPYIGFFEVKINNADELMIMASIDDPVIPSTVDRALVRVTLNPDGTLASESVLAKEGDILPGQIGPVTDFSTGPHEFAFNDAGQTMYVAHINAGTDTHAIYIDDVKIAQDDDDSPVPGRPWSSLSSAKVDLNAAGQYVFTGSLSGDTASNSIIVSNGGVVKQEGDPIGGFTFTGFGTAPVQISRQGRVLWYGAWNNTVSTNNEGIFLDDELLVEEGVTFINGEVVFAIRGVQDSFQMSDSGRYIIFEAVLASGVQGAFQIEVSYCPGDLSGGPEVGLADLATLLSAFGSCAGDAAYIPHADFNFDGCIGLADLAVVLSAFGETCP